MFEVWLKAKGDLILKSQDCDIKLELYEHHINMILLFSN